MSEWDERDEMGWDREDVKSEREEEECLRESQSPNIFKRSVRYHNLHFHTFPQSNPMVLTCFKAMPFGSCNPVVGCLQRNSAEVSWWLGRVILHNGVQHGRERRFTWCFPCISQTVNQFKYPKRKKGCHLIAPTLNKVLSGSCGKLKTFLFVGHYPKINPFRTK